MSVYNLVTGFAFFNAFELIIRTLSYLAQFVSWHAMRRQLGFSSRLDINGNPRQVEMIV